MWKYCWLVANMSGEACGAAGGRWRGGGGADAGRRTRRQGAGRLVQRSKCDSRPGGPAAGCSPAAGSPAPAPAGCAPRARPPCPPRPRSTHQRRPSPWRRRRASRGRRASRCLLRPAAGCLGWRSRRAGPPRAEAGAGRRRRRRRPGGGAWRCGGQRGGPAGVGGVAVGAACVGQGGRGRDERAVRTAALKQSPCRRAAHLQTAVAVAAGGGLGGKPAADGRAGGGKAARLLQRQPHPAVPGCWVQRSVRRISWLNAKSSRSVGAAQQPMAKNRRHRRRASQGDQSRLRSPPAACKRRPAVWQLCSSPGPAQRSLRPTTSRTWAPGCCRAWRGVSRLAPGAALLGRRLPSPPAPLPAPHPVPCSHTKRRAGGPAVLHAAATRGGAPPARRRRRRHRQQQLERGRRRGGGRRRGWAQGAASGVCQPGAHHRQQHGRRAGRGLEAGGGARAAAGCYACAFVCCLQRRCPHGCVAGGRLLVGSFFRD